MLLFGSQARGDAREDSDWDILILIDKERINNDDFDNFVDSILSMMFSVCAWVFEIVPIIVDVDILSIILYSGVWAKFKAIRNKRRQVEEEKND